MTRLLLICLLLFVIGPSPAARANVPIKDAAQLTKRSETSATTVKLLPVTTQRQDANKGVNCAVTTGKKVDVKDPAGQAQPGAGAAKIQPYSPNASVTPDPAARGAQLNRQTLFQNAGTVVGGLDASRSGIGAAQAAFGIAGAQAGTAETVMAALDMNSAARLQNNLTWNSVTTSVNLWLTAINALNLASNSDRSSAALGMRSGAPTTPSKACPVGMIGTGTANDPCRSALQCQNAAMGTSGDACISNRFIDTEGNVLFYLQQFQAAANAAASTK